MNNTLSRAWRTRDMSALKREIHELLHTSKQETTGQHLVRITIACSILASVLIVVLASEVSIEQNYGRWLDLAEALIIILFSIEYLLRLWSVTEEEGREHFFFGRLRYAVSILALIDLLAILPFYAPYIFHVNLTFVRIFRLIILLRVVKLGEYSASLHIIGRVFKKKRHELVASTLVIVLLLIAASIAMYHIENHTQGDTFKSIPATIWWSVSMLTTVDGYAHGMFPVTHAGRVVAVIISLLGITAIGLPAGILTTGLMDEYQAQRSQEEDACPHCGKFPSDSTEQLQLEEATI